MSNEIILFDLPCKGRCACWSPNVWKTRLILNYKNLPYRTRWIEHADITPTFQRLGLEPHGGSSSQYTVPVIILPDGTPVMDSSNIAAKLEEMYPDPPLPLETGLQDEFSRKFPAMAKPLIPVFMPRIARDVLLESSVEWFLEARAKAFGMSLDELERVKGGEQAWEAARAGIEDVGRMLVEHKLDDGPFVLGSHVSFVDFMIVSMVVSFLRLGTDLYERLVSYDENFRRLYEACEEWMMDDQ